MSGYCYHYLVSHCQLATVDLDEVRESMSQCWERHRSTLKRGRIYNLRWRKTRVADTFLNHACTSSSLGVECAPVSDSFHITQHIAGRINHRIDGKAAVSTSTQAVSHAPGQELQMQIEPFTLLLLTFDGPFARRCLEQRLERIPSVEEIGGGDRGFAI